MIKKRYFLLAMIPLLLTGVSACKEKVPTEKDIFLEKYLETYNNEPITDWYRISYDTYEEIGNELVRTMTKFAGNIDMKNGLSNKMHVHEMAIDREVNRINIHTKLPIDHNTISFAYKDKRCKAHRIYFDRDNPDADWIVKKVGNENLELNINIITDKIAKRLFDPASYVYLYPDTSFRFSDDYRHVKIYNFESTSDYEVDDKVDIVYDENFNLFSLEYVCRYRSFTNTDIKSSNSTVKLIRCPNEDLYIPKFWDEELVLDDKNIDIHI